MLFLLHIEDSPVDARLIARHLAHNGIEAEIRRVDALEPLKAALAERRWDLVLADYNLPGLPFGEVLRAVGALTDAPVILLSGSVGEERAVELLKEGVADFVLKDNLGRLVPSIERALREFADRQARRMTEQALRNSEERFRRLFQAAPAALAYLDRDGAIRERNDRFTRTFGYDAATLESPGSWWPLALPDPAERAVALARWRAALAAAYEGDGTLPSFECRLTCRDGSRRDMVISGIMLGDDVLAMFFDITERKASDAQLRKLSQAMEQSPESIIITDVAGRIEYVNAAFVAKSGYTPEEILGRTPALLRSGETPPATYAALRVALAAGNSWQGDFHNRRKDGSDYTEHAIISPLRDAAGEVTHYVSVQEDVTERIRLERELEQHRLHLEELVAARTAALEQSDAKLRDTQFAMDSVGIGVHRIDGRSGRFLYVNRAAAEMLGYTVEEMLGLSLFDIDLDASPERLLRDGGTIAQHGRTRIESRQMTRGGAILPVEIVLHHLPDRDGGAAQLIAFVTDISERRAREQEKAEILAELERRTALAEAATRAKSVFLANMSHEIRTPLNAVLGLAQIGIREACGAKSQDYFTRILDAGHGLLDVINDILDFSKLQAGRMSVEQMPLSLGEVIDHSVQMVAMRALAKPLWFRVEEAPDLPVSCLGDPGRLRQVLVNLLTNAIKFTPPGGRVTLAAARARDELVLAVGDTGVGIAAEALGRLFEPFEQADNTTTRRFGGTGLGLSISRQLIEQMGGRILVRSQPGDGSRFEVRLPLRGAVEAPTPADPPVVSLGLDAEDQAALAAGFTVCRALTAEEEPPQTGLVVVDVLAFDDPRRVAQVEAALRRGIGVVALQPPGQACLPSRFTASVAVVERPLRPRHLRAVLTGRRPAAVAPSPARRRLTGLSVLAVEDNEVNQLVLEDMLRGEGARITLCGNGREAAELLSAHGGAGFDLMLTDIQMPEMDGYALARAAAALAPGLPVIGLTAHAMPEERARCLAAGMVEHVAKPVDINRLVETVLRHVDVAPATEERPRRRLVAAYAGREAFLERLIATVLATHAEAPAQLRAALAAGDLPHVATLAHSLKGTAGNLDCIALHRLAGEAEQAAREGGAETAQLVEDLAEAVTSLLDDLAGHVAPA